MIASGRWLPTLVGMAFLAVAALPWSAAAADRYVLAVSWQPAFCETRPEKPECTTQTADRFDAEHFALHGLWPEPRGNAYCGVDARDRASDEAGRWDRLPAIGLTTATREALDRAMPGSRSFLHRHEWIKHGSCYGASPEGYFSDSLRLLAALNGSPVQALFAAGIGRVVTGKAIRERFDEAFGAGAGDRVEILCRRVGARRLIVELRIGLAGPGPDLAAMLAAAPPRTPGCGGGIVDRVGTGLTDGKP
ncbi:MAG: ribonuclease T2 [Thalassobaculum sp.]|uniref:ribonuclease T2 n=1 Tax=Thalassobaculum sp. TaxID=2022740 RepID=UPI0032EEBBEF